MPDLYSNCVILDFAAPITREQLDYIKDLINGNIHLFQVALPRLQCMPICGEREGNSVVPTIAADEC
jgi:hypothetical protein